MANSLGREIKPGEEVILRADRWCGADTPPEDRAVKVLEGGFGLSDVTSGTAIYVEFLSDGEKSRADGHDIDPIETADWQAAYPPKQNEPEGSYRLRDVMPDAS